MRSVFAIPSLSSCLFSCLVWASVSAVPLSAAAADNMASDPAALAATKSLIEKFAHASDKSDASTLQTLLHPSFRVVFNTKAGATPFVLDRDQYLKMVADGKVGGADRSVSISSQAAGEGFASATARMVRPDAVFQGTYSAIQQDGKWLLLEEAVLMTTVANAK